MASIFNTINKTSCVYEVFRDAGLDVSADMLQGVLTRDVISLLEKNGYDVFRKDSKFVPINDENFFVIRDFGSHYHLEHHENLNIVSEYDPKTIGAIAKRRIK